MDQLHLKFSLAAVGDSVGMFMSDKQKAIYQQCKSSQSVPHKGSDYVQKTCRPEYCLITQQLHIIPTDT